MKEELRHRDGGPANAVSQRVGVLACWAGPLLLAAGVGGGLALIASLQFADSWVVPAGLLVAGTVTVAVRCCTGRHAGATGRVQEEGNSQLHAAGRIEPDGDALAIAGPLILLDREDRIAYANLPAAEFFGVQPGALVGIPWETSGLMARRSAAEFQMRSHPAGGGCRLLFVDRAGGRQATGAVRELPDELYRAASLARIDAIGRFSGGVSHDINNLMGAVAGYADFLVSDLPAGSPLAEYAVRIIAAVDRTKELARQMAVLSQAGAPNLRPMGPSGILAIALARLRPSLPASVALSVREEPGVPDLMGNGPLLAQALADLGDYLCAGFARPATATATDVGRLCLRVTVWPPADGRKEAGRVVHAVLPPQRRPHVLFEIKANGPGRPLPAVSNLFDPFAAKSFERSDGRVDGLRLALVLAIVRGHDGGLFVCADGDQGITVQLMIPAAGPLPATGGVEVPAYDDPPVRKCRILLVDDEPMMGDLISAGLERCGHEVAVCESADEALDVVHEEADAFDVVLTDQSMPGMSGMTLVAEIKARYPDLVCVLYSDNAAVATEGRARRAGADAFYTKPFDVADVARRVAMLVSERRGTVA